MNRPANWTARPRANLTFFRELVEQQHITMLMVSHDSLVDQYVHQCLTLKDIHRRTTALSGAGAIARNAVEA